MKSIVYFFAGAMFITTILSACATDPKAEQEIIANLNTQISNGQASMDRFASSKQNLGMIMQMFQQMPEESKAKYPTEVAETQKKLDALIAYFRSISLPQDSLLKEAYTLQLIIPMGK